MNEDQARDTMYEGYNLIKQGRKQEAVDLLFALTEDFQNNAALWWLLANALKESSPEDTIIALENCQALQPDHEPSRRMLQTMKGGGIA